MSGDSRRYWADAVGNTDIHYAAIQGNTDRIQKLLDEGMNVDTENESGRTALFYACCANRISTVEALLAAGASATCKDDNGMTPFHMAALSGTCEIVDILLTKLTKDLVNAKDFRGNTAMHIAAECGHADLMALLTQSSCSVTEPNAHGKTPLHYAAVNGHISACQFLIQSGASVDAKDSKNYTPLQAAVFFGVKCSPHGNEDEKTARVVEALAAAGADVSSRYQNIQAPLHGAVVLDNHNVLRALLFAGATADVFDNDGRTPLQVAEAYGHRRCVAVLDAKMKELALIAEKEGPKDNKQKLKKPDPALAKKKSTMK